MNAISTNKIFFVVGSVVVFMIVGVLVIPRINRPLSRNHTFHIYAGEVSRTTVQDSEAETSNPGTLSLPRLPHHIDFESSNGNIQIYLVKLTGNPAKQVTTMIQLTDDLSAGRPPQTFFVQATGKNGKFKLHSWPYGYVKYLLLVRSETESDVSIVIHYGP